MDQMPRAAVDPLVVGRVIGDVLDMFVPTAELSLKYGGKQIDINGCDVSPSSAAQKPAVRITGSGGAPNYYTLLMVDPDAPSPSEPTFREWLHWLVIDIPEGSDASEAYRQQQQQQEQEQGVMETVARPPVERSKFKTRRFATENDLGLPAAALYFNSHKQSAGNKKR